MKKSDIPMIKEKIMDLLPMLQVDVWKSGKIPEIRNHRDCSKMIRLLEDDEVIRRVKTFDKERKITTFRIEKLNGNSTSKNSNNKENNKSANNKENNKSDENKDKSQNKSQNKYQALLGKDDRFSPCCGCTNDVCDATSCTKLSEWI